MPEPGEGKPPARIDHRDEVRPEGRVGARAIDGAALRVEAGPGRRAAQPPAGQERGRQVPVPPLGRDLRAQEEREPSGVREGGRRVIGDRREGAAQREAASAGIEVIKLERNLRRLPRLSPGNRRRDHRQPDRPAPRSNRRAQRRRHHESHPPTRRRKTARSIPRQQAEDMDHVDGDVQRGLLALPPPS